MVTRPEDLRSDMARFGPPLFFPEAPDPLAYNFDQGLAARETFPHADIVRLGRKVLDRDRECLDYFTPAVGYVELVYGNRGLREQLAARAKAVQGKDVSAEGIILTSGSVQAIALTVHGYINRGDIIAVEAMSFPYAMRYMQEAGADIKPIPMDRNGMNMDALEQVVKDLAREGKRLKMVYVGPTFHCPTGIEMSLERRKKLVKLARDYQFLVLEDDVYSDLRFAGDHIPSVFSLDDSGFVIQAGTFSKMVAPGLRLGWMMGSPKAIEALAHVRQDLGVSQWISRIMEEFLIEDLLTPHLKKVNKVYSAKCTAAVEGLRAGAGDLVRFDVPRGSFYLWVEIDDRVDWDRVQVEAARAKIYFRPGERFMAGDDKRTFFRMAYSQAPLEIVAEGAKKFGAIIKAAARKAA